MRNKAKAAKAATRGVLHSICASNEAKLPKKAQTRAYTCQSCSHGFGVHANLSGTFKPFCVNCGSQKVVPSKMGKIEDLSSVADSKLALLVCPATECGANLIMSTETAAEHEGRLNCTVCGSDILYEDDEGVEDPLTDEASDEEDDLDVDDDADDADTDNAQEDEESADEDSDDSDDDAEDDDGDGEEEEEESAEDDDDGEEDEDLGGDRPDEDDDDMTEEGDEVTMNLVSLALASASPKSVARFTRIGDRIVCFFNDVAIATLYKDKLDAKIQHAFDQKAYLQAIRNQADSKGIRAALEEFSFEPVRITASKKKLADLREVDIKAEARAEVDAQLNNVVDEFRSCLGIASVGINKNFWREVSNPLKERLVSDLEAAGFRNAKKVVDAAFSKTADSYNRVLLERASALFSKPVDIRNELADAIGDTNYQDMDSDAEEYEEDETEEEEEVMTSLEASMRPTGVRTHVASSKHGKPKGGSVIAMAKHIQASQGSLFPK